MPASAPIASAASASPIASPSPSSVDPSSVRPFRSAATVLAAVALLSLLTAAPARAQDELGVSAEVERPIAATGGDDPTASATEVDARDRPRANEDVADALLEVPGVRPLRTGAFGSPSTLALRGSDADQVDVLLGELPIATVDGSAFDLSTIPLWALDRIDVYRGGAPTWLASSAIGGALVLVPRRAREPTLTGTLGGGSFGRVDARVGGAATIHTDTHDDADVLATAGVTHAQNDFPYRSDVTLLDGTPPEERPRENAEVTQLNALVHAGVTLGRSELRGVALGLYRAGGVPGPAVDPSQVARREEGQGLLSLAYAYREEEWQLHLSAGAAYRSRGLDDPLAEIGLVPRSVRDDALRTVLRGAARGALTEWMDLEGVALWTHEHLWPHDALAAQPADPSRRDGGTFGVEARLHGRTGDVRYELRPSARVGLYDASLSELREERVGERTNRFDAAPTFRLAGVIEPVRGVAISASASSATRAPTVLELFGDRAFLRGNASLAPERAERFDLGLALRGHAGELRGSAELRGFLSLAHDLIRYRRSSRFLSLPENVDEATILGAELGVHAEWSSYVALSAAGSWMETWTPWLGAERRLPYRPRLTLYARPEVRVIDLGPLARLAFFADVLYVGDVFADAANAVTIAERARLGAGIGVEVWEGRMRLDVSVDDLLDARGFDLLGFPLPGRSLYASLTVASR
ncbi:MAG: TonB-dependent receptor [Sandaracinaceae bacterium]